MFTTKPSVSLNSSTLLINNWNDAPGLPYTVISLLPPLGLIISLPKFTLVISNILVGVDSCLKFKLAFNLSVLDILTLL